MTLFCHAFLFASKVLSQDLENILGEYFFSGKGNKFTKQIHMHATTEKI